MRGAVENLICEWADLKGISYGEAEAVVNQCFRIIARKNKVKVGDVRKTFEGIEGEELFSMIDGLHKII